VPRFAHAGHHDSATAVQTNSTGACKLRSQAGHLGSQTVDLYAKGLTAEIDQCFVGEIEGRRGKVHPQMIPRMQVPALVG
jgi:hypothetical protein